MSKYRRRECRSWRLLMVWNAKSSNFPVRRLLFRLNTTRLYIVAMLAGSSPARNSARRPISFYVETTKSIRQQRTRKACDLRLHPLDYG
jgi:hypothetical protein